MTRSQKTGLTSFTTRMIMGAMMIIGSIGLVGCRGGSDDQATTPATDNDQVSTEGSIVVVDYTVRLESTDEIITTTDPELARQHGIFSTNKSTQPITIILGDETADLPMTVQQQLVGVDTGETITVTVTPDQARGDLYSEDNITTIPAALLEVDGISYEVGDEVSINKTIGKIIDITTDDTGTRTFVVDNNDPISYQNVSYEVIVREVR